MMSPRLGSWLLLYVGLTVSNMMAGPGKPIVQHSKPIIFQAAGDFGGGVLEPGTLFPPQGGSAVLKGYQDALSVNVQTTGLAPGAYTMWWIIWNNPVACVDGCDGGDSTPSLPRFTWRSNITDLAQTTLRFFSNN